ncbi:MAG: hypothetical protein DRP71_04595 [Verrucomicrobia bacterium]|nr:MAG: hypothetical protein DRP71_04595 [Verrucomicrobiota bacterium]
MKKTVLTIILASAGAVCAHADDAAKAELIEVGKKNFMTCAACHAQDGQGLKIGDQLMAPSYTGSKVVLGDPELLAQVLLKGITKADTAYLGAMAPLEATLSTDEALAGVMTYIRTEFGNSASIVTVEEAAGIRASLKDAKALTRAEINERLK